MSYCHKNRFFSETVGYFLTFSVASVWKQIFCLFKVWTSQKVKGVMMGILRYAIVYMKGNIIDPSTPSFESFSLLTYYYLLLYCFGKSWRISCINEYFNIINRSKNIKFCNFCVKTLYYEGLWRWWNVIYQLFETNIFQPKIFDITKSLSADNSYAFPIAIFHESQKSCKFDYLHISSVYSTSNDAVYFVGCAMFLSAGKQRSFSPFVNEG